MAFWRDTMVEVNTKWRNRPRDPPQFCCVDAHGAIVFLERTLTEIGEGERRLASDLLEGVSRNVDIARLAFILDPYGNVDAVSINIISVNDDVTDVDTDAEGNIWGQNSQRSAPPFLP